MGNIHFGVPRDLVSHLRNTYGLHTFIETGTHLGATAAWASEIFEQVITIEGSREFYEESRRRHADRHNINFLLGDSRTHLPEALATLSGPALCWLDAHWMGPNPELKADIFGRTAECPVLEEIAAVRRAGSGHFILVDDARLFLLPPPRPHRAADWPSLDEVLAALAGESPPRYTAVYQDVLLSAPGSAREALRGHFQELVTAPPRVADGSPLAGRLERAFSRVVRRVLP